MKSKTSSFNKTLFFGLWKRFWPLFTAYGAIWVLLMPVALGNQLARTVRWPEGAMSGATGGNGMQFTTSPAASFGSQVLNMATNGGTIMAIIFCVLVAMAAYSYLYNPRAVSAMGSLPMKRQDIFRTQMLSGISLMLLINVAVCLITLAVGSAYGAKAGFDSVYIFQWLAIVSLMDLFFYGFATLCASFTGNLFVLPFVYFVLNFAVWGFAEMISAVMRYFVYGFSGQAGSLQGANWFSPAIVLTRSDLTQVTRQVSDAETLTTGYLYGHWVMLAVYALVGIAFAVFATLIIKRRRMETVGDVVALQPLKPAFKYCMTAGGALVLGIILFSMINGNGEPTYTNNGKLIAMFFYMVLGGFIGYFASEMLMQKTLRVFTGKWLGFGVSCGVILALLLCLRFDAFGFECRQPDAADVAGVNISADFGGTEGELKEPESIAAALALQKNIIEHKDINNAAYAEYMMNRGIISSSVQFTYQLKDGGQLLRSYTLYSSAKENDLSDLAELLNSQEAVQTRKQLSIPVNISTILNPQIGYFDSENNQYVSIALSSDEMLDLYQNCIVPDTNERKLGKIWITADESYNTRVLDCTISFDVQQLNPKKGPHSGDRYIGDSFRTTLTLDASRTYDWIENHYKLKLITMGESEKLQAKAAKDGNPVSQTDVVKYGDPVASPAIG